MRKIGAQDFRTQGIGNKRQHTVCWIMKYKVKQQNYITLYYEAIVYSITYMCYSLSDGQLAHKQTTTCSCKLCTLWECMWTKHYNRQLFHRHLVLVNSTLDSGQLSQRHLPVFFDSCLIDTQFFFLHQTVVSQTPSITVDSCLIDTQYLFTEDSCLKDTKYLYTLNSCLINTHYTETVVSQTPNIFFTQDTSQLSHRHLVFTLPQTIFSQIPCICLHQTVVLQTLRIFFTLITR